MPPQFIDLTGDSSDGDTQSQLKAPFRKTNVGQDHLPTQASSQSLDRARTGLFPTVSISFDSDSSAPPSRPFNDDSESNVNCRSTSRGVKRKRGPKPVGINSYHVVHSNEEPNVKRFEIRLPPKLYPDTTFDRGLREDEMNEGPALTELLTYLEEDDEIGIHLEQFSVYWIFRDHREHLLELPEFVSLQDLFLWPTKEYFFDGYLCAGTKRIFVRQVPFDVLSIGNFENLQASSAGNHIWIASKRGKAADVFYRLGRPDLSYKRFHDPFLWTADLVKHVTDYIHNHKRTSIHDFKTGFSTWLHEIHGNDPVFVEWQRQYGDTDFRRVIAIHTACLRSQIETLGGRYLNHPLWEELICARIPKYSTPGKGIPILTFTSKKKKRSLRKPPTMRSPKRKPAATKPKTIEITQTVVTPYVHSCFKKMWFGQFLYPVAVVGALQPQFAFPWTPDAPFTTRSKSPAVSYGNVRVGDVVAIKPDQASVTKWKKNKSLLWYFLVQNVNINQKSRKIHGLWLYTSSDTTLSTASYSNAKELFLSDHCQTLDENDVVSITSVSFFSFEPPNSRLFVRSKYDTEDAAFFTLQKDDLVCKCNRPARKDYKAGQTVLIRTHERLLQPVVLQESTSSCQQVRARILPRARDTRPAAPANELLYSAEIITVPYRDIEKGCDVRIFLPLEEVTVPYSCGGIGNCFYITNRLDDEGSRALDRVPEDIVQGIDFTTSAKSKLNCLDLFCGSGCFGHSVEEASAIKIMWAVDMNGMALHSYFANTEDPSQVQFFCGSVDDFLLKALQSKGPAPAQGQVYFIIAGSPCQGFSLANQNRGGPTSLKNISLIASTAAYIDFYRPQYVLLENVVGMAQTHKSSGQNAFSQLLASFVGMGYQAQSFNLDACVEGAPQQRSRLIIALSAPGLATLNLSLSHRYPEDTTTRSLGKAPNNLPFGERDLEAPRAFSDISIAEACIGLPANVDGKAPSVKFPDHRPPVYDPYLVRQSMICIPRGLPGRAKQSPATALLKGLVPQYIVDSQPDYWKNPMKAQKTSSAFARVWAHRLAPTILATFSPADSFGGQCIHWEEDRPLSVEEARRAQQFPRQMVLFGSPLQRWKQIGNSVPRGLSLALGIALRKAHDRNPGDIGPQGIAAVASKAVDLEDLVELVSQVPTPKTDIRVVVPAFKSPVVNKLGDGFTSSPMSDSTSRSQSQLSLALRSLPKTSTGTILAPGSQKITGNDRAMVEDVQDGTDEEEDDVIYVSTQSTPNENNSLELKAQSTVQDEAILESQSDDDVVMVSYGPRSRSHPFEQQATAKPTSASSSTTPQLEPDTSRPSSISRAKTSSETSPGGLEATAQVEQIAEEYRNNIDARSLDIFDEASVPATKTAAKFLAEQPQLSESDSDGEMFTNEYEGTQWA